MNEAGKGDSPRPFSVSLDKFRENFDKIFGKSKLTKPCSDCNGHGEIVKGNAKTTFRVTCKNCNGKGKIE